MMSNPSVSYCRSQSALNLSQLVFVAVAFLELPEGLAEDAEALLEFARVLAINIAAQAQYVPTDDQHTPSPPPG